MDEAHCHYGSAGVAVRAQHCSSSAAFFESRAHSIPARSARRSAVDGSPPSNASVNSLPHEASFASLTEQRRAMKPAARQCFNLSSAAGGTYCLTTARMQASDVGARRGSWRLSGAQAASSSGSIRAQSREFVLRTILKQSCPRITISSDSMPRRPKSTRRKPPWLQSATRLTPTMPRTLQTMESNK